MSNSGNKRTVVADMDAGEVGTIQAIGEQIRHQVTSMGVRPGQRLEFHTKQPFNGPVVVSVGRSMTSLSREYARKITVTLD
ncbi:FeoA family protein [Halodesulfurarchaeum sp.]|uniref:FeoA family protein n=1 Tax=Halodesulfurarchaeum sp. TaxID=1980530 RepID=UPI002FC3AF95